MKLIILSECQIGAHTFKIVWSPKILDIQDARGGSEYREIIIIRLQPNRKPTATFQTLIHEAIHMGDSIFGRDDIGEGTVRLLGGVLAQFFISLGIEPDFSQIKDEEL